MDAKSKGCLESYTLCDGYTLEPDKRGYRVIGVSCALPVPPAAVEVQRDIIENALEEAKRDVDATAIAKLLIQEQVDDGKLTRLPGGNIIETERLTDEHRKAIEAERSKTSPSTTPN